MRISPLERCGSFFLPYDVPRTEQKGTQTVTLEEIKSMEKLTLTPAQVGKLLGIDPHLIRWQAHNEPEALGFPVITIKNETRIPRLPFLRFITGQSAEKL